MSQTDLIQQYKTFLGQVTRLDCSDMDTVAAHHALGGETRAQVHRLLLKRLADLGDVQSVENQIRRARRYQFGLRARLGWAGPDDAVRAAVNTYLACISAWADGAQLAGFGFELLPKMVDDSPVTPEDLAFCLQEDDTGCQTGVLREKDGSIILWHTEEDGETEPGERFDKLRLFTFKAANGKTANAFIYPDLLPGPTFCWHEGDFVQAVDSLHIKCPDMDDPILPNSLAWISLYLGASVRRGELGRALAPFHGGYSFTTVYKHPAGVEAEKIEFANHAVEAVHLPNEAGVHFFQSNVFDDRPHPLITHENVTPEQRANNLKRVARTGKFMRAIRNADDPLPLVFRMLCSKAGGDYCYSNHDVKAYLVCRLSPEKMTLWVGSGPPLQGDALLKFEY